MCARHRRARSREEFVSKLVGALQEAGESQLWLELLREDCGIAPANTLLVEKEADELMAAMTTMINRTRGKVKALGIVFDDFSFLYSPFLLLKR